MLNDRFIETIVLLSIDYQMQYITRVTISPKVIMRNAQGQDEKDIQVNIMDVPTPPLNVRYSDVYQV